LNYKKQDHIQRVFWLTWIVGHVRFVRDRPRIPGCTNQPHVSLEIQNAPPPAEFADAESTFPTSEPTIS